MELNEFREKISKLTPSWECTTTNIWCPLYMLPNHGYRIGGGTFSKEQLGEYYPEIVERNKNTEIHEDYILVKHKDFSIKLKKL